ncbi:VirD4-like conjugal transfer protein, CD1115 family [uncultured Acetatifactor sp.]|jgi:type IV secretion system protein VirD4|uniref:VirD4-like conjugal transfer protein, CD1115 family n=1 Tax=uncultured Acetatifactor sp. TaxID=1671927 RepID=UPI00262535C5|nr:type IV secretory system conjugative DNA transfer family protein [uncultured Acetatifactor sp.]
MKKKEKLILSAIVLAVGTVLNLFFTAALHGLMSRRYDTLTLVPFFQCLSGLFTERRQLLLFLSFEGFLALCCILFWVQNSRSYQSELVRVAGDIYTPAPSGQYQHGSSRWLKKEERDGVFATQVIDPHNEVIRMLLDTGYEDLPFLEKESGTKNREEDTGQEKAGSVPEDRTAVPNILSSVPINLSRAKEDEDFETVEYVVSLADIGRQGDGKEAEKTPSGGETAEKEKTGKEKAEKEREVGAGSGDRGADPYRLFPKGGIVVGMEKMGNREKLYLIGDDTHTLTIGATRSGKTRCLVIQSICSIALSGESLVISDPKAELYHYTADYLKKLGYEVICLDFKNPEKSTRYNLLQPVIDAINEDDVERAEMYAWDITNILVGDNTSNEKIWENGEKSTIAAAILCVVADNRKRPEYQNLTNVYWFIAEMSKSVGGKTPMSEYMKKLPAKHPARALMSIAEVAPSRTKGSFDTSALTTLRLFTSRSVYAITHKSDYNIADIGRKKQALFLILPDEKTTYYPIASLMVSQLYELLVRQSDLRGGRLENRVNFVLDEFGNFTKLNDFTNKLTVAGGRGVRFNLFLQSFEQLTQKYDKETAAIVKSNCQTWIYLQADDKETLQDVCDKLGKYTTSAYQLSSQHGRYVNPSSSHSISLVARELLTTDEIRRISRPSQIVISRAHPAMMNAPDLSQWYFNRMCGLGDPEHNRRVREAREKARPVLSARTEEIPLWNIWVYYTKDLQLKEAQQKSQTFGAQASSMFSSVKGYRRTVGGSDKNEEED